MAKQTQTEALAAAQPPEKTRKARDRKDHAFILAQCVAPEEEPVMWEFMAPVESDAIDNAQKILATAKPGTYLLTKQVTSLVATDETTRKVARS